jgi:lysozyme family protein
MHSSFKASLRLVLKSEGGNDDDPSDHGGRTSRGITQATYDAWCQIEKKPKGDVWEASDVDVSTIYLDNYWNPWCDSLPVGVDYMFFDMSVNGGHHRAIVLLQKALGVAADGVMGPQTRLSISKSDRQELIKRFTQVKRDWYISLHQPKYTKGWLNRCDSVQKDALQMIS